MIWDASTIVGIAQMRAERRVSLEQQVRAQVDIKKIEINMIAEELIDGAKTFAVDLDKKDVEVRESHDELTESTKLEAYWRPRTHMVILRGGPHDGQQVGSHVLIGAPLLMSTVLLEELILNKLVGKVPDMDVVQYRLAGWDETNRLWVYDLYEEGK